MTVDLTGRAFLRERPTGMASLIYIAIPNRASRDPLGQSALRAQGDLLNRIKLMLPVQSPSAKIF